VERPNHARINFSSQPEDRIRTGIKALGTALKSHAFP
jgi:DNA-binding transcriptional MocR family regulator